MSTHKTFVEERKGGGKEIDLENFYPFWQRKGHLSLPYWFYQCFPPVLKITLKKQRHHFLTKVHIVKANGFSSSHVHMWELDYKEGWALKNWCLHIMVLEETLESPLECKEIKPVHPQGNQPWIFTERTDAETEAPILWLPDAKSWLIEKDPDARKD